MRGLRVLMRLSEPCEETGGSVHCSRDLAAHGVAPSGSWISVSLELVRSLTPVLVN